MPYIVTRSDPTEPPITVPDGSINIADTSVTLVGRNYPNYGQALADNFVHMVENFASPTPPSSPVTGQVWYDSTDDELVPGVKRVGKLKVYDGIKWRSINNVYTSTNIVAQNEIGDILVEVTATNTIKVYDGSNWQVPVFQFSATTITSLPTLTTATDASKLMVSQSGALYGITKENFFSDRVAPGMMMVWPGTTSTIPVGWLICNGAELATGSYPDLYNSIGNRFNIASTPGFFRVPNVVGPNATQGNFTTTNYIIKT